MDEQTVEIAPLGAADLPGVNAVVESAVMGWNLPERVKRLSLPSYRYQATDLVHQEGCVARADGTVVGVAVWEPAADEGGVGTGPVFLLHGLYVAPAWQRRGLGARLLRAARHAVCAAGAAGLLVRAQADAVPFFRAMGWQELPVQDEGRDYPHRFFLACATGETGEDP